MLTQNRGGFRYLPSSNAACRLLIAVSLLLFADVPASPLHAQTAPAEGSPQPEPGVALLLSAATTAGPLTAALLMDEPESLVVAGIGVMFGPLSGYAYGRVMDRGVRGLAFRSIVAGGSAAGVLLLCQLGDCNPFDDRADGEDVFTPTYLLLIAGTGVLLGSAAIDVLSVPDHVSRANASRQARLSLAPAISPTGAVGVVGRLRY